MQTSMGCEIAWEKAAVVSNSETLANRVRHAIGIPTISQPTAVNLGVDFGCGLTRKKWGKSSNRKVRLKAANRRKGRLHVLRLVLGGKRASLIASAGVLSAAIYGAPVNGFSDSELQNLRRLAATAMTPTAQGRSLTALMLVRGDPTWSAAVAPIAQWFVRRGLLSTTLSVLGVALMWSSSQKLGMKGVLADIAILSVLLARPVGNVSKGLWRRLSSLCTALGGLRLGLSRGPMISGSSGKFLSIRQSCGKSI